MNLVVPDANHALAHYEALRCAALTADASVDRGLGLSLFLTRGMTAWLAAVAALRPRPTGSANPADPAPFERLPVLASSERAELTVLLADMVLACSVEVA